MLLRLKNFALVNIASFSSTVIQARTMSTFRVLGVPGHGQTAQAFREKSGCVRAKLKNKCEFVYIEPPFHLEPCDHGGWSRTWLIPIPLSDAEDNEEVFYHGIEHSIALLTEIILADEIDVITAFSMGSALCTLFLIPFEKLQTHFHSQAISISKARDETKHKLAREDYVFESDELFDINNINHSNAKVSSNDSNINDENTMDASDNVAKQDKKAPRFIPKLTKERFTKAVARLRGISFFSGFFFWKNSTLFRDLKEVGKDGFPPIVNANPEGRHLRTYHSYGTDDAVISYEKSEELWSACGGRSEDVFVHPNGHLINSKAKNSYTNFILSLKSD